MQIGCKIGTDCLVEVMAEQVLKHIFRSAWQFVRVLQRSQITLLVNVHRVFLGFGGAELQVVRSSKMAMRRGQLVLKPRCFAQATLRCGEVSW
jgi:hypothetical protein